MAGMRGSERCGDADWASAEHDQIRPSHQPSPVPVRRPRRARPAPGRAHDGHTADSVLVQPASGGLHDESRITPPRCDANAAGSACVSSQS